MDNVVDLDAAVVDIEGRLDRWHSAGFIVGPALDARA
jgi:hypothetical protein